MGKLTDMLELRELHQLNFDTCSSAFTDLCDLISIVDEELKGPPLEIQPYDHSQCQDCSMTQTMAVQCTEHLQSLVKQQEDAKHWAELLSQAKAHIEDAKHEINKLYEEQRAAEGSFSDSEPVANIDGSPSRSLSGDKT